MALNIKDSETEKLAAEVAALAGETKTRAVRVALEQRKEQLLLRSAPARRGANLRRFLEDEAWPQIPEDVLGGRLSRKDREAILGYGPAGV
jgi:antitoxin VapB